MARRNDRLALRQGRVIFLSIMILLIVLALARPSFPI
jgi:hypothetical protein